MRGYSARSGADYIPTPVERSKDGRCQPRVCPVSWPVSRPASKTAIAGPARGVRRRIGLVTAVRPCLDFHPDATRRIPTSLAGHGGSPGRIARKPIGQPDGVDGHRPWPLSKSTLPWRSQARNWTEAGSGGPAAEQSIESARAGNSFKVNQYGIGTGLTHAPNDNTRLRHQLIQRTTPATPSTATVEPSGMRSVA